jgi:hypothetical protein
MGSIQPYVSWVQLARLTGIAYRLCDCWLAKTGELAASGEKMRLLHEKIQKNRQHLFSLHQSFNH